MIRIIDTIARTGEYSIIQIALISVVIVIQTMWTEESELTMTNASKETLTAIWFWSGFWIWVVAVRAIVAVDDWWN